MKVQNGCQPCAFLLPEMMLKHPLDEQKLGNSSCLSIPFLPQGSHYNHTPETDQGPLFYPFKSINQKCLLGQWSLKGSLWTRREKAAAWCAVSYRPFSQNAVPELWSVASDALEELDFCLTKRGEQAAVNILAWWRTSIGLERKEKKK